jgi:hypothetical protein
LLAAALLAAFASAGLLAAATLLTAALLTSAAALLTAFSTITLLFVVCHCFLHVRNNIICEGLIRAAERPANSANSMPYVPLRRITLDTVASEKMA